MIQPTLAHPYRPDTVAFPCLVSEKLDGVRAVWDPCAMRLVTRNGEPIDAPSWFTNRLPLDDSFDGELWIGRGPEKFDLCSGIVRRKRTGMSTEEIAAWDADWRQIRFCVFDSYGSSQPYDKRLRRILRWHHYNFDVSSVCVVPQIEASDFTVIDHIYSQMLCRGAEGLMVRTMLHLPYQTGRSWNLLKRKPALDLDAVVVGHEPGKGKHVGRLGALRCVRLDESSATLPSHPTQDCPGEFRVGTGLSDADRNSPPPIGSIVVVQFQNLTKAGIPRFPVFKGMRADR